MKFVLHRGTGTLVAVNECEIVDDAHMTDDEIDEINDSGEVSDSIAGISLSSVLERLA